MAKKTAIKTTQQDTVTGYTCDMCGIDYMFDDFIEFENFLHIDKTYGYGSHVWGDGFNLELDICEECTAQLFYDMGYK